MHIIKQQFGVFNGNPVYSFTLKNSHGLAVTCLNYGCVITKIMMPDAEGNSENVVLGFDCMDDYLKHSPYFGALIGRVAGRIKDGEFELDGVSYHVVKNNNGNHLHGGEKGFHQVLWDAKMVEKSDSASIEFFYISPDGEENYPGNLEMKVVYTLDEENRLNITYEAITDKTTLLNVTNHSYFNLSGNVKRDILNHTLKMKSDCFLELDGHLIPTGKLLDVEGTPFDFREGRKLGDGMTSKHMQNQLVGSGYDHPFMLSNHHNKKIVLSDEESGRELIVETDEPCVVLYTSNHLKNDFWIQGIPSRKYLGVCLETQRPPDAIHHSQFPSYVLKKGERLSSVTIYTFVVHIHE